MNVRSSTRTFAWIAAVLLLAGCKGKVIDNSADFVNQDEATQLAAIRNTAEAAEPGKVEMKCLVIAAAKGTPNSKVAARETLVQMSILAVPALVDSLRTKDLWIRMESTTLLVRIGPPAVEALIAATQKSGKERFLLDTIPPKLSTYKSMAWLARRRDASIQGRCSVIDALGRIGDERAIAPLTAMTKDAKLEPEVRAAAQRALAKLQPGTAPVVEDLSEHVGDPTGEQIAIGDSREKVYRALGKPKGVFSKNHLDILNYDHAEVHLRSNVVVFVRY